MCYCCVVLCLPCFMYTIFLYIHSFEVLLQIFSLSFRQATHALWVDYGYLPCIAADETYP